MGVRESWIIAALFRYIPIHSTFGEGIEMRNITVNPAIVINIGRPQTPRFIVSRHAATII